MLYKLACVALLVSGCAEQTSERDSALTCDVGSGFGNACVKASEPLAIEASPLDSGDPRRVVANARAYGVRIVGGAGKVAFVAPQTGTYQIYLGTPNIPFRVRRYGETLTPGCTSSITASECSSLRKVRSYSLGETETIEIEFGPTNLQYVRLFVQTQVDAPRTCGPEELAEPVLACEAAGDGALAIDAGVLARATDAIAPALEVDAVYGVRLPGTSIRGGIVRFVPPADGDYELYLGTPNLPFRIYGDNPVPVPATQVCSRYIPSSECNLLRRGTRLSLREGNTYWLEFGPGTNTYVRVTMRRLDASPTSVKLGAPTAYPSANATTYLAVGDLDGDGALDLVGSAPDDASGDTFLVPLENTGSGAFVARAPIFSSAPAQAIVSDFSGDGIADVAAVSSDGQGPLPASYLTGAGDFTFTRTTWGNSRDFTEWLSAGDFDEDGTLDVVSAWANLQNEDGGGGFVVVGAPAFTELDSEPAYDRDTSAAVAGDFDGDGHQDVIAGLRFAGKVSLYLGDGTGAVTFASETTLPDGVRQLAAFDLDADGYTDLVAVHHSNLVSIAHGSPTGLAAPQTLVGTFTTGIAAGDFDHDGLDDLAIGGMNTIEIFVATPSGFVHAGGLPAPNKGQTLVAADLDGDGFDDLAAPTFDSVTVWRSTP